ncbi:unnamed protein product [Allacma fusca]|uniref:Uncharacterized protein n=1 Tax=Allacma fusca TaxID=39272 RepID=A0A8J2P3F2_9HEXA|nr:unnamed protein product [Allacma fusca]
MNLLLGFVTLFSLTVVHGQQSDKSTSIIPFPRIGRADRFYMSDKRSGNVSPGLIPFPRIGRDGSGIHESKRQLIPFPRVGKRPYWHYAVDPYFFEYDDSPAGAVDLSNPSNSPLVDGYGSGLEDAEEKRNGAGGGGMWFGPRLGKRRKRSVELESSSEHTREDLDTKTLVKILRNFNWAIVPVKSRRTFTPRLGRSSEEVGTHHRTQPFSPRLGRSREVSSIELDLDDNNQPRHTRGDSPTTSPPDETTVSSPYLPRLGRDHFSPRLGRSGEDRD